MRAGRAGGRDSGHFAKRGPALFKYLRLAERYRRVPFSACTEAGTEHADQIADIASPNGTSLMVRSGSANSATSPSCPYNSVVETSELFYVLGDPLPILWRSILVIGRHVIGEWRL